MSDREAKNGIEAAALHLWRTLPPRERAAWLEAGLRIVDGVPADEAFFDMLRSIGLTADEARAEIAAVRAKPGDWRQMLM